MLRVLQFMLLYSVSKDFHEEKVEVEVKVKVKVKVEVKVKVKVKVKVEVKVKVKVKAKAEAKVVMEVKVKEKVKVKVTSHDRPLYPCGHTHCSAAYARSWPVNRSSAMSRVTSLILEIYGTKLVDKYHVRATN